MKLSTYERKCVYAVIDDIEYLYKNDKIPENTKRVVVIKDEGDRGSKPKPQP